MILVGFTWMDVALGMLYVSLALLVIVIAYRKLLAYLGKGAVVKEDFCVLYPLEVQPSIGEVEFYFTTEAEKDYSLLILDNDLKEIHVVAEKKATLGGNIVRFDSKTLSNGEYFYCLKTDNQKTMKKMVVLNG